MSDSKTTTNGIGFGGLLAIAFIVLKLCKVIDWSWWWVLSPLWIPLGIAAALIVVCLPFWVIKEHRSRRKKHVSKWQRAEYLNKRRQ